MRAKIISIANHKGGVGKTTTAASVGTILAQRGYKVMLVDMDAQANLTSSLMSTDNVVASVYDAMTASGNSRLPLCHIDFDGIGYRDDDSESGTLDLVPATQEMALADLQLGGVMAREELLSRLLENYTEEYDYIIIDCPPTLGLMTLNAITASEYVIIPLVAEVLPFVGLTMIADYIGNVRARLNPSVRVLGILLTRYERTNLSRQIEERLRKTEGGLVFRTRIRKNVTLAQAPLEKSSITSYDPTSNGAKDYVALTDEIIERLNDNKD